MRILGIETSSNISSVALADNGVIIAERVFPSRQVICQVLTKEILTVIGTETVQAAGLDGIAVSIGPGSFTGLRVGVATAKVLAYCCQVPVVGISTPQVWAAEVNAPPGSIVAVIQPARKGYVYLTIFQALESCGLREEAPPRVVSVAEVSASLKEISQSHQLFVAGDAAEQLPPDVSRTVTLPEAAADQRPDSVRASTIARLGAQRVSEADPDSYFTLRPTYIAISQAERSHGLSLGL